MKINKNKLYAIVIAVIGYFAYIIMYDSLNKDIVISNKIIFLLSWVGIICTVYFLYKWSRVTNNIFTLYNVFLMFFLVFNFGQCLLWAFGVHTKKEINQGLLYKVIPCDNRQIAIAQIIFIICFIMFNCGAMLAYKNRTIKKDVTSNNENNIKYKYKAVLYTAIIISIISIPATMYMVIRNYITASVYGYKALYYGDYVNHYPTWLQIASTLFLPSLLGILVGSNYNKRARWIVYTIFGIYAFISLLCGDRGEWIMKLIILFWADNNFYKKRNFKKMIRLLLIGYLGLFVMNAIVSLRNVGITYEGVKEALFNMENNPIVSLLTEFGNSMSVNIITANNIIKFPYGNTYIMSIFTMFTTSITKIFNMEYVQLHTWFSSDYLKISYGADFTIIGEAILNFGMYLAPLFMSLLGMIISKVCFISYDRSKPLLICISLSCVAQIFKLTRSTIWFVLNGIIYSVIVFMCMYLIILPIMKGRSVSNEQG